MILALFGWLLTVHVYAQPYGRAGKPAENHCAPSYLAMEPDGRPLDSAQFLVSVTPQTGAEHWAWWFVFPSSARCQEAREAVRTVLGHLPGLEEVRVLVGECR